jgi:hypothetical protein
MWDFEDDHQFSDLHSDDDHRSGPLNVNSHSGPFKPQRLQRWGFSIFSVSSNRQIT